MILMYVIAWGVVELSFEMAGGYNPEMKQFKSGNGDGFTVALVLFTVLLSVIMWMMCSTCADKYSTFSIQKKAAKLKAKNPYSDRGKEVKPLNSMIAMIFCTCGAQSMKEDGIDNEEAKKKTDALHLTPPPPPVECGVVLASSLNSLLCRHGWTVRVSLSVRRSLIDQQPKSIHPFVPFVRFKLMVHGVRWLWT